MKKVTVHIPDEKYSFFLELISELGFSFVENSNREVCKTTDHPVLKSIKKGLKEVELVKQGKLKSRPLKDFLDQI